MQSSCKTNNCSNCYQYSYKPWLRQLDANNAFLQGHLSENESCFHSRIKHVAIDFHFIRNQVQNDALRVAHFSSKDLLGNALTKLLPHQRFPQLKYKIGLLSLSLSLSRSRSILRGHIRENQFLTYSYIQINVLSCLI